MTRHAMTTSDDVSDATRDDSDAAGTMVQPAGSDGFEMIPAAGNFLSRTVYTASYTVSYGVVFPVMMIARAVPRENALVHGLVDGARDARDRAFGWHGADWDGHEEMMGEDEAHDHDAEDSLDEHGGSSAGGGHRRRARRNSRGRKAAR